VIWRNYQVSNLLIRMSAQRPVSADSYKFLYFYPNLLLIVCQYVFIVIRSTQKPICLSFHRCIIICNMKNFKRLSVGVFALVMLAASFAYADSASVSIQDIVPGPTIPARDLITFTATPVGLSGTLYVLSDSFAGAASSSLTSSNISGGGRFAWTPTVNDVGTHVISIAISDNVGNSASTTQTITVVPPASVSIESISPGTNIMPGTKLTFVAKASGFTNPKFIAGGTYSGGTSVTNANIDASGNFSWTPEDTSLNGEHRITIYVTDSLGHGAEASKTILVGTGPTLTLQSFPSSTSSAPGQTISFILSPSNYSPTGFSLIDIFSGTSSTLSNQNISSSGSFSWTPQASDIGTHVIKLIGTVGVYGQNASTTATITVADPNAPLPVASATPASSATSTATTTSSSSLNDLLAVVAQLQAQIAEASASEATPTTSSTSGFKFTAHLRLGSASDEVKQLQIILAQGGFLSATPNGRFGPLTAAAVKKFQAAHGLSQLGVVGPTTRAALNAILSGSEEADTATAQSATGSVYVFKNFIGRGDDGVDVLELQKRLALLGYFSPEPNGHFGPATESAVKKFQSANGIRAAGYVGPSTRAALNK